MRQENLKIRDYVQKTANLMEISLNEEYLPGVIDNFAKITAIASLVTEFELLENIEVATVFQPQPQPNHE